MSSEKIKYVSPYYMTLYINRKRQTLGYTTRPVDLTLNWGDKELRKIVKPVNFGVLNHRRFNPLGHNFQKWYSKQVSLEEAKEMVRQGLLILQVSYTDDPAVAA